MNNVAMGWTNVAMEKITGRRINLYNSNHEASKDQ